MTLSALLIAHRLDPAVGRRIAVEMKADQPPLSDHIDALIKLARSKHATVAEDFLDVADDAPKASALRIISAWYLGVVDNVPGATVIARRRSRDPISMPPSRRSAGRPIR